MSIEIEFRGVCVETGEFIYGSYIRGAFDGYKTFESGTAALRDLINQATSMRVIDEDVRWSMYSAAKREHDYFDDRMTRKIIDGLHI